MLFRPDEAVGRESSNVPTSRWLAAFAFHKVAFDILMNHSRNQRLVGDPLFHRLLLNSLQVVIVQTDRHPSILSKRIRGRGLDPGKLRLGWFGQLHTAPVIRLQDLFLFTVNLHLLFPPLGMPSSPSGLV